MADNSIGGASITVDANLKPLEESLRSAKIQVSEATDGMAASFDASSQRSASSVSSFTQDLQSDISKQVGAITGLIGSFTAVIGVATTFYQIGNRIGEALFGASESMRDLSAEADKFNADRIAEANEEVAQLQVEIDRLVERYEKLTSTVNRGVSDRTKAFSPSEAFRYAGAISDVAGQIEVLQQAQRELRAQERNAAAQREAEAKFAADQLQARADQEKKAAEDAAARAATVATLLGQASAAEESMLAGRARAAKDLNDALDGLAELTPLGDPDELDSLEARFRAIYEARVQAIDDAEAAEIAANERVAAAKAESDRQRIEENARRELEANIRADRARAEAFGRELERATATAFNFNLNGAASSIEGIRSQLEVLALNGGLR